MGNNKKKLQALIFDKEKFNDRRKVKSWIVLHDFVVDNRLRFPIMSFDKTFRVRQRNPAWFNKKTFIVESLGKGIKGVYGMLRR